MDFMLISVHGFIRYKKAFLTEKTKKENVVRQFILFIMRGSPTYSIFEIHFI